MEIQRYRIGVFFIWKEVIYLNLEQLKTKVYSLIEEFVEDEENLTSDEDLSNKFNSVANQVLNEMARMKKINAYTTMDVKEGDVIEFKSIDDMFYQLNLVRGLECDVIGEQIKANEDGTIEIHYFKYPTQIDNDTDDSQELDLSIDALEVAVYGIAADLLKSDVSSGYGQVYADRYREMKNELDPRYAMGSVYIEGSINI